MKENYQKQYFETYKSRLLHFKPLINSIDNLKVLDYLIDANKETKFIVVGVLFIVTGTKPSIFDDINNFENIKEPESYFINDMKYYIEDMSGKIEIILSEEVINKQLLTTGAVLGFVSEFKNNKMYVENIIFPSFFNADIVNTNIIDNNINNSIAVISNIKSNDNLLKLESTISFLNSNHTINNITSLYLLGNFFNSSQSNFLQQKSLNILEQTVSKFKGQVYIIPERDDPVSYLVPYNSLEKVFNIKNIIYLTNPSMVNGNCFVPKASVVDILKYRKQPSKLKNTNFSDLRCKRIVNESENKENNYIEALKYIDDVKNMCPTAPDTLKCCPIEDKIFEFLCQPKNVFCSGEKFEVYENKGTNLVVLPDFDKTGGVVVFDGQQKKVLVLNFEFDQ